MIKALFIFVLGLNTAFAFAAQRVTVGQLDRVITSSRKKSDKKIAGRLYEMELTQRLNAQSLAAFEVELPGPESRRALVALADQATFLDPPPAEIPNVAPPSLNEQRAMLAKAIDHVKAMLHRLPDLFARRDTIRYEDNPPVLQTGNTDSQSGTFVAYQPLHPVSRSITTVLYREGQEVEQANAQPPGTMDPAASGLRTIGEFGAILATLFGDTAHGKLAWKHWEKGTSSNVAVFGFDVPKGASHYQVRFCCVAKRVFEQFPAYHGEITVDPVTGNILRLTLIADMGREDPIAKAELMVEYGPVELGAESFYCPIRSLSVSVAPVQAAQQMMMTPGLWGRSPTQINDPTQAPQQTMLNETVFDNYHLFRADVQIVSADNSQAVQAAAAKPAPEPAKTATSEAEQQVFTNHNAVADSAAAGVNTQSEEPKAAAENASSAPEAAQASASSGAPAKGPSAARPAISSASAAAPSAAPGGPASMQEMTVTAASNVPEIPAAQPNAGFSLRVNTRLVDVDVTAYDRKGRPVTDLTNQDFVIYDNGRRQSVRSFNRVSDTSESAESLTAAAEPIRYSNRLESVVAGEKSGAASAPGSSTILLLDPTSLGFADLTYARQQILKFLEGISVSEPVGLYVRSGSAFHILQERTTDHAAVMAALKRWVPTAPDLALAQEAERRNRQQFDTVDSPADMQGVNGNVPGMVTSDTPSASSSALMDIPGGGGNTTMDPKLMKEGKNPAREALSALVTIAAHMNAIPGHKDLVWVASDNVLANWADQAPGTDKGPNSVGRYTIGAQEALNDAHVSLYALDASQLGTAATDASLQNNGVQLDPAVRDQYPNEGAVDQMTGARASAQMRQNMRAVQPAMQNLAQATGGRTFQRSDNLVSDLNSVVAEGNAAYLLSFAPDIQPDGQYHRLTVEVPSRRGIRLRYRAGYLYTKEPATLKDRLRQAIWQPRDETEIALSARWSQASEGSAVSLRIGAGDVALAQTNGRWTGKLDVFLVQKDETGIHAAVKEQTLALNLKPDTYEKVLQDGIPFAEFVEGKGAGGTVRVIVVDKNSGRIGSITLPASLARAGR